MTLIGIACHRDRAEIVTDTAHYSLNARHFGTTTKVSHLHHMDAALTTIGPIDLGRSLRYVMDMHAAALGTFDELLAAAPDWVAATYAAMPEFANRTFVAFLVGWSEAESGFVARAFSSREGFQCHRLGDTFLTPTPWSLRPSPLEIEVALANWKREGRSPAEIEQWRTGWLSKPAFTRPTSAAGWVKAVRQARAERSLGGPFGKVFVAGEALLTQLEQGRVSTQRIFKFDDGDQDSDEFRRMVEDTDHPVTQLGPCDCGSGRAWIDCCMVELRGNPCACGSGEKFGACCMVRV